VTVARPVAVRRTSHIDMSPDGERLRLSGRARDMVAAGVHADADVSVEVERGRVRTLATTPDRSEVAELVGLVAGSGFRAAVGRVLPAERGTALGLLLDDIPVAALISGYIMFRVASLTGDAAGAVRPDVLDRMTDMCSGWRGGGTAVVSIGQGRGLPLQDCPPAPDLDGDWHDQPRLGSGSMRRRRRIDVSPAGDGRWAVDAMFRDTFGAADGEEVLHEYSLTAVVGDDGRLEDIDAVPVELPFAECPWAAGNVRRLVGERADGLRSAVPRLLAGIDGCTHLNDLLRALGDVPWLIDAGQALPEAAER
jgi:hypothetical protein